MKIFFYLLLVSMSSIAACGIDSKSTSNDESKVESPVSADAAASMADERPLERAAPTTELPTNTDAGMQPATCNPDHGKGEQPWPPCDYPSKDPEDTQQNDSPNQGTWDDPGQSQGSDY